MLVCASNDNVGVEGLNGSVGNGGMSDRDGGSTMSIKASQFYR